MIEEPLLSIAALVARIFLSMVFLVSGIDKSINFSAAMEEFSAERVPLLPFSLIATIVLHLAGSVCLIAGWFVTESALLLALFTLAATIHVHDFWNMEGSERVERSRIALANLGLVGGLLLLAAVGPGTYIL